MVAAFDDDLENADEEAIETRNREPILADVHGEPSKTSTKPKKTRGSVSCRNIIDLEPGEKLEIEFNSDCQPIGKNACVDKFFLGQTVRNRTCCPLQVESWGEISDHQKDYIWEIIQEKFSFDVPEMKKPYIMRHMGNIYRYYRYKLKANYFDCDKENKRPLKTFQERKNNRPKKVQSKDWEYLCHLWGSPKFQEKSVKAKDNRALQKMPHYAGSKSYAQIKEDFKNNHKREPSRADILIEARKRQRENVVDAKTLANNTDVIERIRELRSQRENGQISLTDDQILEETIGADKHGYLHSYGPGKSITEYFGVKPSRLDLARQIHDIERKAKEEVEEANKRVDDAKKGLEEKLEANNRMWIEKLQENNDMWEERWWKMREELGLC